jgi:outer membrane protein insertion porin family
MAPRTTGHRRAIMKAALLFTLAAALLPRAAGAAAGPFENRTVASIDVAFDDFNGRESLARWKKTVLASIHLKEGAPFTTALLEESKRSLSLLGMFSSIAATAAGTRDGVAVSFRLTPYRLVRDIVIRGNYPIFEKDITNVMTIEAGGVFRPEALAAQEELVRKKYAEQGYPDAAVSVTAGRAPDGNYVITVSIDRRQSLTYCDMSVHGNRAVSDAMIRLRLATESERFIEPEFKKQIAEFLEYYRGRGYPEAAVSYRTETDPSEHCVYVDVDIVEGPRYRVDFVGNTQYRNFTLLREVTIFKTGNRNNLGARKSAKNIAAFYHHRGYLGATVRTETAETSQKGRVTKTITFRIDEGPRTRVASVTIAGASFFKEKEVRSMISTGRGIRKLFDPDQLNNDLRMIESRYRREGFAGARAAAGVRLSSDGTRADIAINVGEGPRTMVTAVEFSGARSVPEEKLRKAAGIAPGNPYRESAVADAENIISALVAETGHPYVAVSHKVAMSDDGTSARITFVIDEGRAATIGSVGFRGNLRTSTSYLARETGLKPGGAFTPSKIAAATGNIGDIAVLQSYNLKSYGLDERNDRIDLVFDIREKKAIHLGVGAGFKSDRGLFADASVEDDNFLGRYKSVWLKGGAGQTGFNGSTGFNEPRLIGSSASAGVTFSAEQKKEFNKSFSTLNYGPELSLSVKWLEGFSSTFGAGYSSRKMSGAMTVSDLRNIDFANEYRARDIITLSTMLTYDRRDSVVRPRDGLLASGLVEVSIDPTRTSRSVMGSRTDNFVKYALDLTCYYTPVTRLTFAAQGKIGYIQSYTSVKKPYPDTLWYLGGMSTVRGFDENMLRYNYFHYSEGGRAMLLANLEARIDLGRNFEMAAFLDAGRIEDTFYDIWRLRASAGLGLRYVTPIGPLGIMYGFKLDRRKGEEIGMLHFSVGYSF